MPERLEDFELIGRFKRGDTAAFEEIVLKYQDRIYNVCRGMLANPHDAEDTAQEIFLKAFQALDKFNPDASLYTWLYRIAVNTCLDHRKSFFSGFFACSREVGDVLKDIPADGPSPDRVLESRQIRGRLDAALGKLPYKLRIVIVLKEFEGLSYEEIAGVLDISAGTVKSRISRARERLRESFKDFREQI